MIIHQVATSSLSILSYLVIDPAARKAVVVDPVRDIASICALVKKEGVQVTHILETHVHADFVSGARELQYALGENCHIVDPTAVKDKDSIQVGGLRFEAWYTPGHTPEHISWIVYDKSRSSTVPCAAFTGDFLFVGSIGRPDLLGQSQVEALAHQLYHSVMETLSQLPDHLEIYPSHSAGSFCGKDLGSRTSSTLGYERLVNPYLRRAPEQEWTQQLMHAMPRAPSYFSRIKDINAKGPPLIKDLNMPPKLTLQQISALDSQKVIICDTRFPELFAPAHIAGSLNLPLRAAFAQWAADLIKPDAPLYLLVENDQALSTALTALRIVGLDRCDGYAYVDEVALQSQGLRLSSFPLVDPTAVGNQCILDVRQAAEHAEGHPVNALLIELSQLGSHLDQVPKNVPIAVLCKSGNRASIAASMLARAGFKDVSNIRGGMDAWKKASLPSV